MKNGDLPNFKKFHADSHVFVTDVDVNDAVNLEPWIQWFSVHTGVAFEEHGVFHLTDGPNAAYPDIWRVLSKSGYRVGNFSSMNAKGFDLPGSFFLPDPWCVTETAHPRELSVFHDTVARQVQEYTNPEDAMKMMDYVRFLFFIVSHGLSVGTSHGIARQLMAEKLVDGRLTWKRVPLLDRLQFDVFKHYLNKVKPDFSTFFSNSTAHYQHAYWRHMDPDAFLSKPSEEDVKNYGDAILYGYQCMDRLLERFFALERQGYRLILATALSQQPFLRAEDIGGQRFYRPRDVSALLARVGVQAADVLPVMTHQYVVRFADDAQARNATRRLGSLHLDGTAVFEISAAEGNSVRFGCALHRTVPADAEVVFDGHNDIPRVRFFDEFYCIDGLKSGRHHPDGVLWIKSGTHMEHDEKVSILDIFPTLLDHFQIQSNDTPDCIYKGRSLLPDIELEI